MVRIAELANSSRLGPFWALELHFIYHAYLECQGTT